MKYISCKYLNLGSFQRLKKRIFDQRKAPLVFAMCTKSCPQEDFIHMIKAAPELLTKYMAVVC